MNRMRWTLPMLMAVTLPANAIAVRADADKNESGTQSAVKSPSERVRLAVRDWKGVQKLVKSHKGKVVVVDIWTTTCLPCIEEFPEFAALKKEFGGEKVALISVNCDYDGIEGKPPKYYRQKVLAFLRKQEATFDNVMLNVALIDFLDQIDLASTPAIFVYDQKGKLVKRFDNDEIETIEDEFTMDDVRRLVRELIEPEVEGRKLKVEG